MSATNTILYSIPTRRELVKEAARNPTATEIKETQHEQQEYLWTTDPISKKPLVRPVVSDPNGKLYNKISILEHLLPAEDGDDGAARAEAETILLGSVKSLKDVVEIKFELDEEATVRANGAVGGKEIWKCPVTGDRLGPGSKAVYLVPCGHAFSGNAIREVSGERCLQCDEPYASNDVIPILSTAAPILARLSLRAKTLKEQGLTHSLKKMPKDKNSKDKSSKKRKKADDWVDRSYSQRALDELTTRLGDPPRRMTEGDGVPKTIKKESSATSGIKNSSTASLTARVLEEEKQRKKIKLENDNVRSLFSSRDQGQPHGKSSDFMTRGYSIPTGAKR